MNFNCDTERNTTSDYYYSFGLLDYPIRLLYTTHSPSRIVIIICRNQSLINCHHLLRRWFDEPLISMN